jgi:hypothetical protein
MRKTAAVLVIAASLLTPLAITALWLRGQVLNTHRYVRTVTPLAQNDAVVSAVADEITTACGPLPSRRFTRKGTSCRTLGEEGTRQRRAGVPTRKARRALGPPGSSGALGAREHPGAKGARRRLDRKPPAHLAGRQRNTTSPVRRRRPAGAGLRRAGVRQRAAGLLRPKFQIARGSSIKGSATRRGR